MHLVHHAPDRYLLGESRPQGGQPWSEESILRCRFPLKISLGMHHGQNVDLARANAINYPVGVAFYLPDVSTLAFADHGTGERVKQYLVFRVQ